MTILPPTRCPQRRRTDPMNKHRVTPGFDAPDTSEHGPDQHSAHALQVLQKFRLIFRSVKQHFRWVEERCGVSGAQLWLMFELKQIPGLRVSEIARALSIHQSTASNMLDKLERRDLIERRREGADRRVVRVFLTSTGKRVIDVAPQPARGVLTEAINRLPYAALQNLEASLDMLIFEMKVRDQEGAMQPISDL